MYAGESSYQHIQQQITQKRNQKAQKGAFQLHGKKKKNTSSQDLGSNHSLTTQAAHGDGERQDLCS